MATNSVVDHGFHTAALMEALQLLSEQSLLRASGSLAATGEAAAGLRACRKRAITAIAAASTDLHAVLERARPLLSAYEQAAAVAVDIDDIVAYASRISGTTGAPDYWKPGMPMVGFVPPAPLPEMMRSGALTAYNNAGTAGRNEGESKINYVDDCSDACLACVRDKACWLFCVGFAVRGSSPCHYARIATPQMNTARNVLQWRGAVIDACSSQRVAISIPCIMCICVPL